MHPETLVSPRRNWQDFTLNVLNGNSLGIIIALLPPALTSQVLLLFGQHPLVRLITMMTSVSQSMLPIIAAFAVGYFLRLSTLASASIGLASVVSAGVVTINPNNTYTLAGTGAILNIMLVTFISALLVIVLEPRLGQLKIIFLPTITLLIGGGVGLATLPWMIRIQNAIGNVVAVATHLSPLPMGIFLGLAFAALIVSCWRADISLDERFGESNRWHNCPRYRLTKNSNGQYVAQTLVIRSGHDCRRNCW